eukprot:CAMPEP_0196762954 /NCGR_PEP_ID=MMETSP1095-20130614/3119_1 /TAXON_ID=96789 ORGANISM="Chromulina nebulosa, Strain UTEXLB2642" /NCGR_SAMPLE_ID=MMETSP1095 /ASSEMBLY_ACC=CAM_ASM_000446 /LENGTH=761 /DNA_ID=CAMNT_0042115121 /DNA_START=264 /DNA_END=2549 /DNA_ORIENTATION=+
MLAYVASNQSFDIVLSQIIPLLEIFANDHEPAIRQTLVEQLGPLAKYCAKNDEVGYRAILDRILPIIARLLEDTKPEVRHTSTVTLVEVANLIRPDDLGQHVLTIVLRLAHEDDKEEMRMTASELLNMLAECLGQDLCRQFVIPEVVSLAEDPVFRVRKSTALNFHNICKVGGEHELFERLMPAFVRLSKDDMYRVRRACADSLSDISKHVSDDIRVGVLVEIFLRLTQDPSKLVKQSVLQQSGMFIATLPSRAVSEIVLGHFCSMAGEPTGDMTVDTELKHYCAYCFPAVLQTIGPNRWKEVREVYHSLTKSRSVNVKQSLAASLHEIARILSDRSDLEEEFVPVFEDMIQDSEEVQMGVIKNLAVFLSLLSEPCRVSYLPVLHDILHSTNPFNWRLRQSLAVQLPELLDLPPKHEVYSMLFPLIMTLLQDPVAGVRKETYKGVAKLILMLHDLSKQSDNNKNEIYLKAVQDLDSVIRTINSLVLGETYQLRQLWLELTNRLLRELPQELFESSFLEGILRLTTDSVCNVRVAVASLLVGWEPEDYPPWVIFSELDEETINSNTNMRKRQSPWTWLLSRSEIHECIERLSNDDADVYNNIIKLQRLLPNVEFNKISCRGKKSAPGGDTLIQLKDRDSSTKFRSFKDNNEDGNISLKESNNSSRSSNSNSVNSSRRPSFEENSMTSPKRRFSIDTFPISSSPNNGVTSAMATHMTDLKYPVPPPPPSIDLPAFPPKAIEGDVEDLEELLNTLDMGRRPSSR